MALRQQRGGPGERAQRAKSPHEPGAAWLNCLAPGARSSVGERSLHTREVAGSKPAAPITRKACNRGPFFVLAGLSLGHRIFVSGSVGPIMGPNSTVQAAIS